jgi:hypothetical protein
MSKRVIEPDESAMFNATAPLGHDMAPSPRKRVDFAWECQSCGRMAYQEGGRTWGTATDVMCDEPDDDEDED